MVLLLLPPLTVDNADVYPQMSTGLLVLGHHNISAVHYRKVWKKMFPFLEEIEKKTFPCLQEFEENITGTASASHPFITVTQLTVPSTASAAAFTAPARVAGTGSDRRDSHTCAQRQGCTMSTCGADGIGRSGAHGDHSPPSPPHLRTCTVRIGVRRATAGHSSWPAAAAWARLARAGRAP